MIIACHIQWRVTLRNESVCRQARLNRNPDITDAFQPSLRDGNYSRCHPGTEAPGNYQAPFWGAEKPSQGRPVLSFCSRGC
jgi:hypothetical protein